MRDPFNGLYIDRFARRQRSRRRADVCYSPNAARGVAWDHSMHRVTVVTAFLLLLTPPTSAAIDRPQTPSPPPEVTITLVARAADPGNELVNFGLPLPPGFLSDAGMVRVYAEHGDEIEAAVRSLEPWRIDGKDGA